MSGDLLKRRVAHATSHQMNISLAKHFAHPVYGIVFEVARGTGYAAGRHIDALAMGLWPSRGMELVAIEVKVSRGDFRRELKQPEKAEELAQYCDRFYIAAPEGMIPVLELPPNWGLLERRENGAIMETKPAAKLDAKPVTLNLLAAVMRAACRPRSGEELSAMLEAQRTEFEAKLDERVEQRLQYARDAAVRDAEKWRKVEEAIGEKYLSDAEFVQAAKVLVKSGVCGGYRGLASLTTQMRDMLKRLDAVADLLPSPEPDGG